MRAPSDRELYYDRPGWPAVDPAHTFKELCLSLAAYDWTTLAAATLAESYRGFNVGAMLVAHDPAKSRIGTYFGGNIKRLPGPDPDKICAERVALRKARAAGYPLVIGLAVIGPYQPDQESSRESRTLHPCGECRREFASASEMTPDTLFATHRLGEEPVIMERFTLEWLLREYCVADN